MKAPRTHSVSGGPSVCILVPVLKRPHRVVPLLESIAAATLEPHRVLFIADEGDSAELTAIEEAGAEYIALKPPVNYAAKINAGASFAADPFVFLGADDLNFHPGWFEAALARMSEAVAVVGTNDLCNPRVIAGEHATHFLVRRDYLDQGTIDEPGKLLHEGYPHEWVDNEFIETAKHRGAYAHAFDSVVEHLHPMVGKAPMDELYAGQGQRMAAGRRVYRSRRHLWT